MKTVQPNRTVAYGYNFLEIMLATVVVIVGVVGVMTLFPISQQANRTSVGNSSSADAGDQFVRVLASKMKVNWDLTTALPMSKPEVLESDINYSKTDSAGVVHTIKGVSLYYDDTDGDGEFDYDGVNGDVDGTGFFKIVQSTDSNVEDFSAIVRVWRAPASYRYYNAATGTWSVKTVPPTSGIELNVELSFPSQLPYDARTKRHFALNVFRPLENPSAGYIFAGVLDAANINLPPVLGVEGTININPNNASGGDNPEFYMTIPGGSISRDDLLAQNQTQKQDYYTGMANGIWVRPKGAGNQNGVNLTGTIELNGFENEALDIQNQYGYQFSNENGFSVKLYNAGGGGTAGKKQNGSTDMGNWYITIKGYNAVVTKVF